MIQQNGYEVTYKKVNDTNAAQDVDIQIRVGSISGTTAGQTALYTVPTGYTFICERILAKLTTITGAGGNPTLRIGTTGGGYIELLGSTSLANLLTAGYVMNLGPLTLAEQKVFVAGDVIKLDITTGSTRTAYIMGIELRGILQEV